MVSRQRPARPYLAACSALSLAVLVGGLSTPAHAAESANTGEFISIPVGESTADTVKRVATRSAVLHVRTPADKKCTGVWKHAVSNVDYDRTPSGTLRWGFKLTARARAALGSVAAVSMPYAYVNDKAINPPYQLHRKLSTYNFHGSMNKYQRVGSSYRGVIATGNKVTFSWLIKGSNPRSGATRYITCKVPAKGSS
ncbi:hypothetical protein [Streptomyces sp. H27-C3]|uniref:hypothetical protein n=1 Tax=Streptomyces sp. H27-C3 TaxID=3046305 RepID=UPI0024BB0BD1|nr:hypothetical protein [Streptomyces sp. H27-C3]MDJ0465461.1 hypothetical protein [Streptomyces sp. H27-C3]